MTKTIGSENMSVENENKLNENKTEISVLSKQEQEHATYLAVYQKYKEYAKKRLSYRRWGMLFIIISGLAFLTMMFRLESKITFLCLWIITIIFCVVLMIRADYLYNDYKELLGLRDEFDEEQSDVDGEDETQENNIDKATPKISNQQERSEL